MLSISWLGLGSQSSGSKCSVCLIPFPSLLFVEGTNSGLCSHQLSQPTSLAVAGEEGEKVRMWLLLFLSVSSNNNRGLIIYLFKWSREILVTAFVLLIWVSVGKGSFQFWDSFQFRNAIWWWVELTCFYSSVSPCLSLWKSLIRKCIIRGITVMVFFEFSSLQDKNLNCL